MESKSQKELPYEENTESFGKWFREAAKEKWEKYLKGDEKSISIEERDTMRNFLIAYGTQEEISDKLGSVLDADILAYETLCEEIKSKRPDIQFPDFEIEE